MLFLFRTKVVIQTVSLQQYQSLNFRLAHHVADTNTSHLRDLLPMENSPFHLHSAPYALLLYKQAKMMNRYSDVKQPGEPSPAKTHKINFHPILLAAAYLSFARIVVNFHPGKYHYFCKPKQLVGHLRVKPLPPGVLQNGTTSSGPMEGGRGLTLECGMSPSPYQHFSEACTCWLKRSCGALRSAPQAGPWRGRTRGKQNLPRLHSPSVVLQIRNLKSSGFCPVKEHFSVMYMYLEPGTFLNA